MFNSLTGYVCNSWTVDRTCIDDIVRNVLNAGRYFELSILNSHQHALKR